MIDDKYNLKDNHIINQPKYAKYFDLLPTIISDLNLPKSLVDTTSYLLEVILNTPFGSHNNPLIFTLICIYFMSNRMNYEITFRYLINKYQYINPERNFLRKTIKCYRIFLKEFKLEHPKSYLESMIKRFFKDTHIKENELVCQVSLKFAQTVEFKGIFYPEFRKKSHALISAVAIYCASQAQDLFIPAYNLIEYFKIPFNAFNNLRKVIEEKYPDIESLLSKDPEESFLEYLFL